MAYDTEGCTTFPSPRGSRYRYGMNDSVVTGLLTDKYELTMLAAALRDGSANRRTTFELLHAVFPRDAVTA